LALLVKGRRRDWTSSPHQNDISLIFPAFSSGFKAPRSFPRN
jgi:hypothetical protein